jgi:hypothetical protein
MEFIWSTIAGTLSAMIIGFLWYGPFFSKQWIQLNGFNPKQLKEMSSNMGFTYGTTTIAWIVTAVVMKWVVLFVGAEGAWSGAMIGALMWLGFATTTQFVNRNFSRKPFGLYILDTTYWFVIYVVMGIFAGIL